MSLAANDRISRFASAVLRMAPGSPDYAVGLRAGFLVLATVAAGIAIGEVEAGLAASFGALMTSTSDPRGSYPARVKTLAAFACVGSLTFLIASLTGGGALIAAAAAFLIALVFAYCSGLGTQYMILGAIPMIYVVALAPDSFDAAITGAACFAVGAFSAVALLAVLWPFRQKAVSRVAISAYLRAAAAYAREEIDPGAAPNLSESHAAPREQILHLRAAGLQAEALLHQRRSRSGRRDQSNREIAALLTEVRDLSDRVTAIGEIGSLLGVGKRDLLASLLSNSLTVIADAVATGDSSQLAGLQAGIAEMEALSNAAAAPKVRGAAFAERIRRISDLTIQLNSRAELARPAADLPAPRVDAAPRGAGILERAKQELNWESEIARHALRVAVTAGIAVGAEIALSVPHGYWIPMTAIIVMQPDIGSTAVKLAQRMGGTLVGVTLAALIMLAVSSPWQLAVLMAPLAFVLGAFKRKNYGIWAVTITALVLLQIDTTSPHDWSDALMRIGDTLIGGLLGVAATVLLWPTWQRNVAPSRISGLIAANRGLLEIATASDLGDSASVAFRRSRTAAITASQRAEAACTKWIAEATFTGASAAPIARLTALCETSMRTLISFAASAALGDPAALPIRQDELKQLDGPLHELEIAVDSLEAVRAPSNWPPHGAHAPVSELRDQVVASGQALNDFVAQNASRG